MSLISTRVTVTVRGLGLGLVCVTGYCPVYNQDGYMQDRHAYNISLLFKTHRYAYPHDTTTLAA